MVRLGESGHLGKSINLFHDEEIVEPTQEEVFFLGGFMPVALLEFFVVADHGDDVNGLKIFAHGGEEFKPDGHEHASLVAGLFLPRVRDIQAHVPVWFHDAMELADHHVHRFVVGMPGHDIVALHVGTRVELADAAIVIGIVHMGRVWRVNEREVDRFVGHRQLACVGVGDLLALWIEIESDTFAVEIFADIEGGS